MAKRKSAKRAKAVAQPRKLTTQEALKDVRDGLFALKVLMAGGSKSETDAVGTHLDKLIAKCDASAAKP